MTVGMIMDSEQELNKRLAERAGFEYDNGRWYEPGVIHIPVNQYYENYRCLPNFPQSLDACFKWLWPLLDGFMMFTGKEGIHTIVSKGGWNYEAVDKEPAMSFSLAIDKPIDSEKGDKNETH